MTLLPRTTMIAVEGEKELARPQLITLLPSWLARSCLLRVHCED